MSHKNKTLQGKLCMVTGATDGIGKATATALAAQGAHLIVVGRNCEKAEKTVAEIRQETNNPAVEFMLADFSSQQSTRDLAEQFLDKYDRLDVLVNNAGLMTIKRTETADGVEMMFAVNHLGYFLLTNLLLDTLVASAPARIVNVSSGAHEGVVLDFDDLNSRHDYGGMKVYGRSKLANIYFTYELARRLEGTAVTVNALHPGFVATNIGANNIPVIGGFVKQIINIFANKDVEDGAQTSIYLASSPEVDGVTGKYFVDCKPVSSTAVSYDQDAARRLWKISAEMVGLDAHMCYAHST